MNYEDLHINGSCECVYNGEIILAAKIMLITPEIAEDILAHNTVNRKLYKSVIDRYAGDMLNGRWKITGDTIVVDKNGNLKNGQHRLTAVMQSGKPILMIVAMASGAIYDIGKTRSVSDIVELGDNEELKGGLCTNAIVGAANVIIKFGFDKPHQGSSISKAFTIDFIKNNLSAFRWLRNSPIATKNIAGLSSAVMAALACAYHCGYPIEKLEHFMHVLCEGFSTNESDRPIILLRNYLLNTKYKLHGFSGQVDRFFRTQYVLHAYERGNTKATSGRSNKLYYSWGENYDII